MKTIKITNKRKLAILLTLFLGVTMIAIMPVSAIPYSQYDVYADEIGADNGHDHDSIWGQGGGDFYLKVKVGSGSWDVSSEHELEAGEKWGDNNVETDEFIKRYSFAYSSSETLYVELWEADTGDDHLIAEGSVTISSDDGYTVLEGSGGDCYGIVYVDYTYFSS